MTQLNFPFINDLPEDPSFVTKLLETPIDYETLASEIGVLLNSKQKAYGNAFGEMEKIITVLYPQGIKPYQYKDALTLVRILDKIFRIANLPEDGKDLLNEDPWSDIAGYSILALSNVKKTT